jgi:hypothetical protein
MNDLKIIALSCCTEALSIDSENLLWRKLKMDYSDSFSDLIERTRFNRRRHRLSAQIERVQYHVDKYLEHLSRTMIVDSTAMIQMYPPDEVHIFSEDTVL